jgi:hypothetical protein
MEFYRKNSVRVPSIAGEIVPEPVYAQATYEEEILGRMYRDIAPLDPEGFLRDEFLNSRGAIPRFGRGSIEIRVVDVQESPASDLALVALSVGVLRTLVEGSLSDVTLQKGVGTRPLSGILLDCIRDGEAAVVSDPTYMRGVGFPGKTAEAGEIWLHLLGRVAAEGGLPQPGQQRLLERILRRGTLSTEILRALGIRKGNPAPQTWSLPRVQVEEVYRELAQCLQTGEIFLG